MLRPLIGVVWLGAPLLLLQGSQAGGVLCSGVGLGPHMPGGQPSSNFSPIALVYFCHQNRAVKLTVSIAASV